MENNYDDYRGTVVTRNDSEVLQMIPSYHQFEVERQMVELIKYEIGDNRAVVLLTYQSDKNTGRRHLTHYWLTVEEAQLIINKLKEFIDGA